MKKKLFLVWFIIFISSTFLSAASPDKPQNNLGLFRVPKSTTITDPNYVRKGVFGGLSDGKTIGVDGKRLEEDRIYSNDTFLFAEQVRKGMQVKKGPQAEKLEGLVANLLKSRWEYESARSEVNLSEKV